MVQVDVPMAFAVGVFLADAAGAQLRSGGPAASTRVHLFNLLYQIFFFCWVPVYFLLNYFGWETTHMWWSADSVTAYPYYLPVFLGVFFVAGIGGCALGVRLVRSGRTLATRLVCGGLVLFSAAWIFGQTGRTLRLGSYREWKDGAAPWFHEDRTFTIALILTLVWWAAGLALFWRWLRRPAPI